MERVTHRLGAGILVQKELDFRIEPEDYDLVQTILARLAAYEDTGLEPEEIMDRTWISAKYELPVDPNEQVLAVVNGEYKGRLFVNAFLLGTYTKEGWILEMFPAWENPIVTHWMYLPEMPKEE